MLALVGLTVGWIAGASFGGAAGPPPAAVAPPATQPTPSRVEQPSPSPLPSPSRAAPASTPAPTATPVALDGQFGMSGHLMWGSVGTAIAQLDMLAQDGLGVVRFDASWRNMEPSRGTYQWLDKLDAIVAAAEQRSLRIVIVVDETPAWANGGESAWVPPEDPADYARFVGMLAGRYAGRVTGWEIWNEPDLSLFWQPQPDAAAYARLLVAASRSIRSADPSATVVGGSIAFNNTDYARALYDHGVKGSFDVLSVHPYTLTRAPDDTSDRFHSLTATLDDFHALLRAKGDDDLPIWITELGWAVVGLNSVSKDARVGYLAHAVELIRERPWVGIVTVYTINTSDSARYGLSTDGQRSDAWTAYVDAVRDSGQ